MQRLSLLAPEGNYHFTSPLYIRSTFPTILPSSASALAPAKAGHTSSPKLPTSSMLFKSLNHIDAKQRLSLLAPEGNYHFTSPLYIRSTFSNHSSAKRTACVCPCPDRAYPLNLSSPFILYSLKTLHFNHFSTKRTACVCPRLAGHTQSATTHFMQMSRPPCRLRQHCTSKPRNPLCHWRSHRPATA